MPLRDPRAKTLGPRVDNLRILLVDDVLTTRATLHACARALKKVGASKVLDLTVGRSVPGWPLVRQTPGKLTVVKESRKVQCAS